MEPFCGGLAVSLGILPSSSLLNDINRHVINFYEQLKRGLSVTIPMENSKILYYTHRERFNHLIASGKDGTAEAAQLFYFLNKTGFNGLCRFNQEGLYNVPFGSFKTINYLRDFSVFRRLFSGWKFCSMDFEDLDLDPADFIYADPPYDVDFKRYAPRPFSWDDQVRLVRWLASHEGPIVLSNQATPRIMELYKDYKFMLKILDAPRSISCNGNRARAQEVLAVRNLS